MATLRLLNLVLAVTALALFVNLIGTEKFTGNVVFALDKSEPQCFVENQGGTSNIDDLNQCCFALQEQLACTRAVNEDFVCTTSDYGPRYFANTKTISYCKTEGYRLKL